MRILVQSVSLVLVQEFAPVSGERIQIWNHKTRILKNHMGIIRSHNRRRRPQARGPRKIIEKDKCAIFSENCATLNVINTRGYTQICVGLGDSLPRAGLEAPLHDIDKKTSTTPVLRQIKTFILSLYT